MEKNEITVCPTMEHRTVEMLVPVCIKPFAIMHKITTKCSGTTIMHGTHEWENMSPMSDCSFTIKQHIDVDVPVEFGVETTTGEVHGHCDRHFEDCDCGCVRDTQ